MNNFKGTKGKWIEVNGKLEDENGNIVPSKSNFYACGGYSTDEYFKDNENYIKAIYNDKLKAFSPEMLEMLEYFTDFPDEDFENVNEKDLFTMTVMAKKIKECKELIKKATE